MSKKEVSIFICDNCGKEEEGRGVTWINTQRWKIDGFGGEKLKEDFCCLECCIKKMKGSVSDTKGMVS